MIGRSSRSHSPPSSPVSRPPGSGDYAIVGTTLQIVGESVCEAVDLRAGQRVLDVAAANGNATLAAARRFADVVSTDYVGCSRFAALSDQFAVPRDDLPTAPHMPLCLLDELVEVPH